MKAKAKSRSCRNFRTLLLTGLFVLTLIASVGLAESSVNHPHVTSLLKGARSVRLSQTQGVIHLTKVVDTPSKKQHEETKIIVEWKNDSLRFREMTKDDKEIACSIRHDGDVLFHTDEYGGSIDNASHRHIFDLFDPRLLGARSITLPSNFAYRDLLPPDTPAKLLSSSELVDGFSCEKILWGERGTAHVYWIANRPGFPILKIKDYNNNLVVESTYESGEILPDRVRVSSLDKNGEVKSTVDYIVDSFTRKDIDDRIFSINGLGLDVGDSMTDQRLHEILGYWNGEELAPSRAIAFEQAAAASHLPETNRRWYWIVIANLIVLLSIGIWIVFFRVKANNNVTKEPLNE